MNAGQTHPWGSARAPAGASLQPGDHLDRYELLCPLAQGGMAAVWLARLHGKHGFQKLFAVKTILPQFAEDIRFQQMFLDEARIAAGISHPFVAQILDLGEERGILYIVMEWVDGDSLAKLLRTVLRSGQSFPLNIALRITADVAGALHAAHELHDAAGSPLGVVHRDVSPSNILLSTKGAPKVIDFGIAKAVGRLTQETSAGLLKGKVLYMSPEQATGRPVDRRADVWALGAVLHTVLAGEAPFTGDNEMATLHRLTGGGPPNPLPPNVPEEVRDILARALHLDVGKRTPTCAQLQLEIEGTLIRLGMATTAADVANYAAHYLADTDVARHDTVQHALDMAAQRANGGQPPGSSSGIAVARAPVSGPVPLDANAYPSAPPHPTQAAPVAASSHPAPAFAPVYPSQSQMAAVSVPSLPVVAAAGPSHSPSGAPSPPALSFGPGPSRSRTPAWAVVGAIFLSLFFVSAVGTALVWRLSTHAETRPVPPGALAPIAVPDPTVAVPTATASADTPAAEGTTTLSSARAPIGEGASSSPAPAPADPAAATAATADPAAKGDPSGRSTKTKPARAAPHPSAPDFGF